jgi:hypothetical protein
MDFPGHENLRARILRWRRSWAPTGWLLLGLGALGLIGWTFAIRELVQPLATRAPIRPPAALGLLILGIGILALDRKQRRITMVCAVIVMLLGYLALLQLTTGMDLGFDRLIPGPSGGLPVLPPAPETLPVATAIGFLLGGGSLAIVASRWRARASAFAVGLGGATLAALNLAMLAGMLLGLSQVVQFGRVAGISPQAAIGLFALGVSLSSWAWRRDWSPVTYPAWIPVAVGLASLAAVLLIWRALAQGQRDDHAALLSAVAHGTEGRIDEAVGRVNLALWRVAWLSPRAAVGTARWAAQVGDVLDDNPGISNVAWIGRDTRTVIYPARPDSFVLRAQLALQLSPAATPSPATFDSVRHFSLADTTATIAIAIPHCDLERCDGFVVGLVRVDKLLRQVAGDSLDGFKRRVTWRGQTLFGPLREGEESDDVYHSILPFNEMTWELAVWPTRELRERMLNGLPDLVLALGLLITALLPLTLQLIRTLKANAHNAERVRLRLALGHSMDRAWSWELTQRAASPAALISSSTGQEQRQGSWTELIHPEERGRVEALLEAHLQGKTAVFEAQYRLRDPSGAWRWRVDRGRVIERGAGGTPLQMLGVSGDVSERRRVEEERESTERRFRAVFDSAYHFQALLDLGGRVLEANSTALHLLGPAAGIENLQSVEFWQAAWWPTASLRERIKAAVLLARDGQTVTEEVELQNANGDRLIFDLSLKPIQGADLRVVQLLVEGRDITAARRAEAQLREVETLSSIGRVAARVAHEINNPLAGIQNSFLLLRDAIPPQHPHYAYVGAMEREIARIASVTRQLYETYRSEGNGAGGTGVRTLIGDAVALLEQVNRPSKVRIHADLEAVPSQVAIPESVLRQSVYNLVQNAVEASPPGGTVTVKASVVDSMFVLTVRDEGPGVPGELRSRIFQPFVSSKERNASASGMGIGLSMVQRSVTALGGSIDIADPPQGGAEFVVRIPLAAAPQKAAP